jgi:NAD(P)-dependent dehydrogenase (short-subunit alcohol dehydrogenase family)
VLTTTSSSEKEIARIKKIASLFQSLGSKQTIVLSSSDENMPKLAGIHAHRIDLLDEEALRRIFNTAKIKFGQVDAVIHFTGDYNYEFALSSLSRADWDQLVDKFVFVPALIAREATNAMAPAGAIDEPSKYKSSSGTIIIVGPDAPTGKVSGTTRARSEVFRGALRPFIVTANQELADVLNSDIRVFLILCGNIDGKIPDGATLENSVAALVARAGIKVNESIFYIDESRK